MIAPPSLILNLDRAAKASLVEQIRTGIRAAIVEGRLAPGARLPSWQDLAAQLGVARGTVKGAYEGLIDDQLIVAFGAAGTRVADFPPVRPLLPAIPSEPPTVPVLFRMGLPAQDAFPYKLWSRILGRAARSAAALPVGYPDPRGEPALRQAIAASLALARGIACAPSQILITSGYAGALGLAIRALGLEGAAAWLEEPGYPLARKALGLAGIKAVPVPVDAEGLDVAAGIARAPKAALVLVTPGQQAPLGMALSLARRRAVLDWAERDGAWILEDDYLSELQLAGRAAPALASVDRAGRVIHIGSFSKTISPGLRLGFVVVPAALAGRFAETASCLAPAPGPVAQLAVAEFLRDGHYLRHLRRMKRLYALRRDRLKVLLGAPVEAMAGLALLLRLPVGADDVAIAEQAQGMTLSPLSSWYAEPERRRSGLLLGVTNAVEDRLDAACAWLTLVQDF